MNKTNNWSNMKNTVIQGDCLIKLKELEDNSVDSIVTDPPYELGFMGKSWDNTGIANNVEMWKECLRVLKPGGHLLTFSGTRTYHRMACAIEDAGFEVRDMIEWVYGSGFPKSLNIGKAVDKLQGNEREIVGKKIDISTGRPMSAKQAKAGNGKNINEGWDRPWRSDDKHCEDMTFLTKGTSEWEGWGTALKPAHEPICMARKPLSEKTVAENCLKWGTGGINIDESRVEYQGDADWNNTFRPSTNIDKNCWIKDKNAVARVDIINRNGRFPANLIHDNSEEVRECFPESKGGAFPKTHGSSGFVSPEEKENRIEMNDSGNASRFFKSIIYQAKASKSERNRGCEELEEKIQNNETTQSRTFNDRCLTCKKKFVGSDNTICHCPPELKITDKTVYTNKNNHPTVKPIALMEYLIKMVTPKGGTVLDPFAGSGSTLVAAKQNGYQYIGIEMTEEYIPIIEARLK